MYLKDGFEGVVLINTDSYRIAAHGTTKNTLVVFLNVLSEVGLLSIRFNEVLAK